MSLHRETAGMKISTYKSQAMILSQKRVKASLWLWDEFLLQVEEFKYLWALWGRGSQEINRQIGTMTAVMWMLQWSVVVKRAVHKSKALNLDPYSHLWSQCLPGFWSVSGDHVFLLSCLSRSIQGLCGHQCHRRFCCIFLSLHFSETKSKKQTNKQTQTCFSFLCC